MTAHARFKMDQASALFHGWEGTTESPRGSNRIRCPKGGDLWTHVRPSFQGAPYCAAGDVDVYLHLGIDLRLIWDNPFYTPYLVTVAQRNGWWKTSGARAGDLVLYGTTGAVHTGIASPAPGALYYAHEANTSSGNSGSQANGDGVFHRGRARSWILGWVDMEKVIDYMIRAGLYVPGGVDKSSTAGESSAGSWDKDYYYPKGGGKKLLRHTGEMNGGTYHLLSRWAKQGDSANSKWTSWDVKTVQRRLGVEDDGSWGPQTTRAMQRVVGADVDGEWGPESIEALQRFLNRGVVAGWWSLP